MSVEIKRKKENRSLPMLDSLLVGDFFILDKDFCVKLRGDVGRDNYYNFSKNVIDYINVYTPVEKINVVIQEV